MPGKGTRLSILEGSNQIGVRLTQKGLVLGVEFMAVESEIVGISVGYKVSCKSK